MLDFAQYNNIISESTPVEKKSKDKTVVSDKSTSDSPLPKKRKKKVKQKKHKKKNASVPVEPRENNKINSYLRRKSKFRI